MCEAITIGFFLGGVLTCAGPPTPPQEGNSFKCCGSTLAQSEEYQGAQHSSKRQTETFPILLIYC